MPEFTREQYGCYTIRKRVLHSTYNSPSRGIFERLSHTEYQVWHGRKIISRHAHLLAAEQDARARIDAFWDEQAKQLRALTKGDRDPDVEAALKLVEF